MYITKEFVAYCRKLLRALTKIENALNAGNSELAKELVKELKEDAERDRGLVLPRKESTALRLKKRGKKCASL